jgi:hypothetical protein
MTFATMSGPLRAGTVKEGPSRNTGLVLLAQQYDSGVITGTDGTSIRATPFRVPKGAYIVDFIVDALGFPNGFCQFILSIGTTLDGADLMNGLTVESSGIFTAATQASGPYSSTASTLTASSPTLNASAKRTAALNADAVIYTQIYIGNANATQGRINITMLYVQRDENGAQNPVSA